MWMCKYQKKARRAASIAAAIAKITGKAAYGKMGSDAAAEGECVSSAGEAIAASTVDKAAISLCESEFALRHIERLH